MSADPRYSNGNAMRKLTSWLRSQGRPCWICRAFGKSGRIDYSLPARHPYSFELDHLVPVSKWDQAGYVSAQACALDKRNVDAALGGRMDRVAGMRRERGGPEFE